MTTRLAVTTDWIHRCADLIFQCLNYEEEEEEEHDEHAAQSPRTGPLCEGISPRSVARWVFWKKQIQRIFADLRSEGRD